MLHNTQHLSSYPAETRAPGEHDHGMISSGIVHPAEGGHAHSEGEDHHKSVIGIVKEKAKKLKSKIKKHREHSDVDETSSGEEEDIDENGNPNQVEGTAVAGSNISHPLEGVSLIPDPNAASVGSGAGVHEAFGNLSLTDTEHLQEHVPSAAGQASAGVTPYLAAHGFGGKAPEVVSEGQSPNAVPPAAVGTEETESKAEESSEDVGKAEISKNAAVEGEKLSEESESGGVETGLQQEGKTTQDNVEGITNAVPAASVTSDKESSSTEPKKSMLEHAKERIFGSNKSVDGSPDKQPDRKPSITSRAADTMISLKDAVVSKLGYGAKSSPKRSETRELKEETPPPGITEKNLHQGDSAQGSGEVSETSGTTVEKIQGSANQLIDTVVSNVQKVQAAAADAEEALASKLGYGAENVAQDKKPEHESDSATSEVASEGSTGHGSASAAARFHPGEEDRALSQLITEKLSLGASTLKGTLMRPFGVSKSRPSTPVTPPPTSAPLAATASAPIANDEAAITAHEAPSASDSKIGKDEAPEGGEKEQGIVEKVSESINSLLGSTAEGPQRETEPGVVGKVSEAIGSMLGTHSAPEKKESSGDAERSSDEAGVCAVEMH